MNDTLIEECPGGCNHSSEEHFAFDLGAEQGEQSGYEAQCPTEFFEDLTLREAWLTGHSVGCLNKGE